MSTPNGQNSTRTTRSGASSGGRLPSLRPIRDLSLGGGTTSVSSPAAASNSTPPSAPQSSTRPKFTPNLAAAGRRQTPASTPDGATNSGPSEGGGRGRGRGGRHNSSRGGRGRGRGGGKFEHEIIQSKGIFSEGLAEADVAKSRVADSDDGGGGGGSFFARRRERADESKERQSKTGGKSEAIETDEEALKHLLQDDFIAHRPPVDRVKPVTLPLRPEQPPLRSAKEQKVEDGTENALMDVDLKPDVTALIPSERKPSILKLEELAVARETLPPAFQEMFRSAADDKSGQGSLFFVQLPNVIADLVATSSSDKANPAPVENAAVKAEVMEIDDNVEVQQSNGMPLKLEPGPETAAPAQPAPVEHTPQKRNPNQHTLAKLPQGQIGKLQFMKSGKIRLMLNGAAPDKPLVLDAAPGTQTHFLQQAVSIRTPNQMEGESMDDGDAGDQGQLCIVGDVRHRMLFTPKIDNLLVCLKKMTR